MVNAHNNTKHFLFIILKNPITYLPAYTYHPQFVPNKFDFIELITHLCFPFKPNNGLIKPILLIIKS